MRYVLAAIILTLAVVTSPAVKAQQAAKTLRVGVLAGSDSLVVPPIAYVLPARLSLLGYVHGRDVVVESRFAQANEELPGLAGELVASGVDVLVADGVPSVAAASTLTTPLSVVGVWAAGPGQSSLSPPGPRITGVVVQRSNRQRLEVLRALVPDLARVAVIHNAAAPDEWADVEHAARALGLELFRLSVRASDDIGALVRQAQAAGAAALLIPDASPRGVAVQFETAGVVGLPTMFPQSYWVRPPRRGLMSVGVDMAHVNDRVTAMVDKILKGAKPGELPVELVSTFELVINRRSANVLGVKIPPPLLQRANKIVE